MKITARFTSLSTGLVHHQPSLQLHLFPPRLKICLKSVVRSNLKSVERGISPNLTSISFTSGSWWPFISSCLLFAITSQIFSLSSRGRTRLVLQLKKRRRRKAKKMIDITRTNFFALSHFWNIFDFEFLSSHYDASLNFDILTNLGTYEGEITPIVFSVFPILDGQPSWPLPYAASAQRLFNLRILKQLFCSGMFGKAIRITISYCCSCLGSIHTCGLYL